VTTYTINYHIVIVITFSFMLFKNT